MPPILKLTDMNVRISKEDVKHFDREENGVQLPDGSGYIGTLNVYHEIHCIVTTIRPTSRDSS